MIKLVVNMTFIVVILMHMCIVLAAESEQSETDNGQISLKVEIVDKPSTCATTSQRGNVLKVHYTGYLLDGEKFDSRLVRGQYGNAHLHPS